MESKNSKLNFTNLIEELQGKFDRVFEYVQSLKSENESLKHKIESLETEIEKLKRENEELRKNGVVLFSEVEREELKKKIAFLLERINQYL
ncbi:Protein of unknown function (DUF904) [Candidatus Kryptonium thompsonii]|jgi:chromosome segregation ATPase|uniref:Cell division protein ZapB n=1 Tax=Candidatus Kryptonium thompsonii TaxID=1633631 RepID=A0A0P1P668_9BACT|nr:cell division protein ZapB [Candidatus Kryptonium thompsoni]CUS77889.1 Protein of unknown function (DUF904) [Candidatus Kryptonium thompsoni]CUS83008.1 Protein of unknown function (DUF904) [Candidatus Kryptonium thompsoni]CUS87053.1 Protein of unknown function (DUF904) [Candidatus Kryptonium thompsoni]CUS90430.1 Protein of unknown function (DUF904) [Candidatus Kryptonium thompsoni]CUS91394.1 Protein of unknown function (DUF904) [Candidatus Kryptonium thompsoni]